MNLRRSLAYNVVTVVLALAGWVNPLVAAILMPLSSLLVLAGALGVERRVRRMER
jgi:Cu2+-exporting ATPase